MLSTPQRPATGRRIHLDWAAAAPLLPAARDAMVVFLECSHGNPSSVHGEGRRARMALEDAREAVAGALGAAPSDVLFTSGGTEADNLAVLGAARACGRRHLVVSAIEHAAVLRPAEWLAREGFEVTFVRVGRDGRADAADFKQAIRPDTGLVALMAVNNETGVQQPVREVAAAAHAAGALFFCDAVQAWPSMAVDALGWDVDLLSVSAHKIGGPKGVGALYVKSGVDLAPLLLGGSQENGRRGGTENVAACVGMAAAAAARAPHSEQLDSDLVLGVLGRVPGSALVGAGSPRVPRIACFTFEDVDAETLLFALDLEGVSASSGAACSSHSLEPSPVLLAMGCDERTARSAVRFSWGPTTTAADVAQVLEILPRLVERNRATRSPRRGSL